MAIWIFAIYRTRSVGGLGFGGTESSGGAFKVWQMPILFLCVLVAPKPHPGYIDEVKLGFDMVYHVRLSGYTLSAAMFAMYVHLPP